MSSPSWSIRSPLPGTATWSPPSRADTRTPIICALLGAPRRDWQLFSDWTDDIKKLFDWNVANDGPAIVAA
jgi:hypothetical protein